MKAIILAAGRSQRIKPIEDKNFLCFLGKTLLQHQIDNVKQAGFDDITVIGGAHNLDAIKELGINAIQQENLDEGMAGAMKSLEPHLSDNEPIMILSANDYLEGSAFQLIKQTSEKSQADSLLLAKKVDSYFPGGYIALEGNRITEIVEKPGEGNEPSDMINIVLHVHRKPLDFIKIIHETQTDHDDWYEVAIDKMIKDGKHVEAVPYGGYWQAIKFPWHVLELQKFFLKSISTQKIAESAQIAETAVIEGQVVIEEGVKIFDHATVVGPAYIGKNTVIATGSLVRDANIGENCVIGFNSEVARSYIDNNVWLHMNYIGDSVVCDNVSFGAGTVTGNLRLDEQDVHVEIKGNKTSTNSNKFGTVIGEGSRIGINVSIMPGIKIGKNSFIAGGLIIGQDITDNSFVKGKTELEIRKNTQKAPKRS